MATGGAYHALPVLIVHMTLLAAGVLMTSRADASVFGVPIVERAVTYTSKDHRLTGHVGLTVRAQLVTQCARRCDLHPGCASFNWYQDDETCELNLAADTELTPVTPHQGATYIRKGTYTVDFDQPGVCSSTPCENGGWCMEVTTHTGTAKALCICKEGWTGIHCTDKVGTLAWSEWLDWGRCSASCGQAWRSRRRDCTNTLTGDKRTPLDCLGRDMEIEPCQLAECPSCEPWAEWSACSTHTHCGRGRRARSRRCSNGGRAGVDRLCQGISNQTSVCHMPECDEPLRLREAFSNGTVELYDRARGAFLPVCADGWTQKDADVACRQLGFSKGAAEAVTAADLGVATPSSRYGLSNVQCLGTEGSLQGCTHSDWTREVECTKAAPAVVKCIVDGSWSNWSQWGECSVTCATGKRVRSRACDHPAPAEGGAACAGADSDQKECTETPCPVDGSRWRMWNGWSQCSSSCNGGARNRKRTCDSTDVPCSGPTSERQLCSMVSCAAAGKWSTWAYWSLCDVSCDGGVRLRGRQCEETNGLKVPCTGHDLENSACGSTICPGSPWRPWAEWSPCSSACGGGWETRRRHLADCGDNCEGTSQTQSISCNPDPCPVDGLWLDWSEWTACNETCGGGFSERERVCIPPRHDGAPCPGQPRDVKDCNTQACPIDGYWKPWAEWGECSVPCGGGNQTRARQCQMPLYGGEPCDGPADETRPCNTHPCAENAYWMEWAEWTPCNASCNGGFSRRTRTCVPAKYGGEDCQGDPMEQKECNTQHCPIDCVWNNWSEWESCNVTCNDGHQRRTRANTAEQYGGVPCDGATEDWQACNPRPCPVNGFWEEWAAWTECSKTCSNGTRSRDRVCRPGLNGGANCTGVPVETERCFLRECPVDGVWEEWSVWTDCSVTCANGTQTRNRTCDGPFYGGASCGGPGHEVKPCSPRACPVDGEWGAWSEWTRCSKVCGGGTMDRQRNCTGRFHGGEPCPGDAADQQACNTQECSENGYWEMWSDWGQCTTSCGTGTQERIRECIPPKFGGDTCSGNGTENQDCNTNPCPVDGGWRDWAEWDVCNVTCGGGYRRRLRDCEPPKYGGNDCQGSNDDWAGCSDNPCPIDGYWLEWGEWQTCNTTCGGGHQMRLRECEPPKYGGNTCDGPSDNWQTCNTHHCPVDGYWLEWGDWQTCNTTCGGGHQMRVRECEPAKYGGNTCDGPSDNWQICNTQHCPVPCGWQEWGAWENCNVTCAFGHQRRMRGRDVEQYGGASCDGPDDDWQQCKPRECPVDCVWKEWSPWDPCNVTCGAGYQLRRRDQEVELYGGAPCSGETVNQQACFTRPCPVDGVWDAWTEWGACPVTCGGSVRLRNRTCEAPLYGGRDCEGPGEETKDCGTAPCPIPGDWLQWGSWSACSVSCEAGTRSRTRECDMQSHGNLTAPCPGNNTSVGDCHEFPCSPLARTCDEWVARGLVDSVIADIKPAATAPSFRIDCDVDFKTKTGTGRFGHNKEGRHLVQGFEGAGEYEAVITYLDADGGQLDIDSVFHYVDLSTNCKQYISWECNAAGIHHPLAVEVQTTFWTNRYDVAMTYWGGASPGTNNCACGVNHTCANVTKLCNCDLNDNVWRQDDGFITHLPDLPIHSFRAGDTGLDGYEEGYFTIGSVICAGTATPRDQFGV